MGHYFEWRGTRKAGHADTTVPFFREEYGDPTCIMGGEDTKFTFVDATFPALIAVSTSRDTGPGMNPALVDQCGWIDADAPRVRRVDQQALGSALLKPWHGAPAPAENRGPAVLATLDGWGPDAGRIYACIRESTAWDRNFPSALNPLPALRLRVYLSTSSGDSLLLANEPAAANTAISLGIAPIRITVNEVSPEGVTIEFERSSWRGSVALSGVTCDPAAQVATAASGELADAFVIDTAGDVRFNHFNGHGWELLPWQVIDGVKCDPQGGIAAISRHAGLVEVFVTDTEGLVRRRKRLGGGFSPVWETLPGGGLGAKTSLACAKIDEDSTLLCGVRPDRQVSRVEVIDQGLRGDWTSAPPRAVRHIGATTGAPIRGRIYGVDAANPDRSLWATPDIASPDAQSWGVVGKMSFDPATAITAAIPIGLNDAVVFGTTPLSLQLWKGAAWEEELLGAVLRQLSGGLSAFSRHKESLDIAFIDPAGQVNIASWSPDPDFKPAMSQYQGNSIVVLQASDGHFVQAKNGGGDGMGAEGELIGDWEKLRMLDLRTVTTDSGKQRRLVVFQTHDSHYVGAVGGGGSHLIAEATAIGPWETFYLDVSNSPRVTIQCIDESHFWTANNGGGAAVGADKTNPQDWETFVLGVQP
ncbi:hypothetical protein FHX15_005308 [Rhizobium sp. BK650]|uniref:hypothetical protein n=1 Tax=Rhizobium sp. BK650 TaxID=2586990 RepID=UPI001609B3B1|nr:hypothetical protein [Rhizobium sp. BK650]MBB3660039.1 hypothetical protein [Rhizobium sp. BK650]